MKLLTTIFLLITNIYANELSIKTYEAKFSQMITNPSGKTITYTGIIYIKAPNNMKWQYLTPVRKNIIMKDEKIIIDEPELEQAIYTQLTDEINLIELLNNPDKIDEKYKLTFTNKNNLEPKKLTDIQYEDELENKINISFTNIKINKEIKSFRFMFVAPSFYDIIRK